MNYNSKVSTNFEPLMGGSRFKPNSVLLDNEREEGGTMGKKVIDSMF